MNSFYIFRTKFIVSDLIQRLMTEKYSDDEMHHKAEQSVNSYRKIRNSVVISLLHLGISPVLLCDKTDVMNVRPPEERALAGQGPWAAAHLFCSAEHTPRQALI